MLVNKLFKILKNLIKFIERHINQAKNTKHKNNIKFI